MILWTLTLPALEVDQDEVGGVPSTYGGSFASAYLTLKTLHLTCASDNFTDIILLVKKLLVNHINCNKK